MNNQYNTIWDPTGQVPNVNELDEKNSKVFQEVENFKTSLPKIAKKSIYGYLIFLLFILLFFSGFIAEILFTLVIITIIFVVIFFSILRQRVLSLKKDLIKFELAKVKGWQYEPSKRFDLYKQYYRLFPEIFDLGEKYHSLEDIFWGRVERNQSKYDFVSGVFNYTYTVTTTTKNGTSRHDVNCSDHFFILKLPRSIDSRFYLFPKNLANKFTNLFTKKNLETESIEFNKQFSFSYKERGSEVKVNIMSILSPRVMEEIVNFSKTKGKRSGRVNSKISGLEILFTRNEVIFLTPGPLITNLSASLSPESLQISQSDIDNVDEKMKFYIDIGTEISKYLN